MHGPERLFAEHVERLGEQVEHALAASAEADAPFDGVVFHSGAARAYHAQDRPIEFRPVPHFARFAPLCEPDQLLVVRPGRRPKLVRVEPRDFWHQAPREAEHPWRDLYDVVRAPDREAALREVAAQREVGSTPRLAYVGDDPALASRLDIDATGIEPEPLLSVLDWHRGIKTAYEVECIREAARVAGLGHRAARSYADDRASERQIHAAYLSEAELLESDTPYGNIIAWDAASAVLHYQAKRTHSPRPGATFLIDAGASYLGYASDITRTYAYEAAHPLFHESLAGLERLQRELVDAIRPGLPYVALHEMAVRGVCDILSSLEILKIEPDAAIERGLAYVFLPHGVGHHLGLQVHDVGGQQARPTGGLIPPPPQFPYLRTTRELAVGQVVTVEPGLYFIPMLLDPHRDGADRDAFDWERIDALIPCGGIRIEDDILVTQAGSEDLSRPFVPGVER